MCIINSCTFPGHRLAKRTKLFDKNSKVLKELILLEFPNSTYRYPVSEIKNGNLKNYLTALKASEIQITYRQIQIYKNQDRPKVAFDSTITITWLHRLNGGMDGKIAYEAVYYFFGSSKPNLQIVNKPNFKFQKYNDSIWIHSRIDDIIVVH